jgi:hypothetical protein
MATEAEVRQEWDRAQEELQQRVNAEKLASDKCGELQLQIDAERAAAPAPLLKDVVPVGAIESPPTPSSWPFVLAIGILAIAEFTALRLAARVLATKKSTPLLSVEQVAELLPVPIFAAIPAASNSRPPQSTPDENSITQVTLWLLACEGTLAVLAFVIVALTMRNIGFPAELIRHPIETMARGLHDLHP